MATDKSIIGTALAAAHRRAQTWENSDTLSLQLPPRRQEPSCLPKPLSAAGLRRLKVAQRQLDRARATVEAVLGSDYRSGGDERLLDGFDLADHHLDHAIRREAGDKR